MRLIALERLYTTTKSYLATSIVPHFNKEVEVFEDEEEAIGTLLVCKINLFCNTCCTTKTFQGMTAHPGADLENFDYRVSATSTLMNCLYPH